MQSLPRVVTYHSALKQLIWSPLPELDAALLARIDALEQRLKAAREREEKRRPTESARKADADYRAGNRVLSEGSPGVLAAAATSPHRRHHARRHDIHAKDVWVPHPRQGAAFAAHFCAG